MIVSKSPEDEDVVFVTEVWLSKSHWDEARNSFAIAAWAKDMASLLANPPQSVRLDPLGGRGLS